MLQVGGIVWVPIVLALLVWVAGRSRQLTGLSGYISPIVLS